MTATCTITRPGERVWNPESLQYETGTAAVYTGGCRVKRGEAQDRGDDAANQAFIESLYLLYLPVDGSEVVRKDDTVTVTGYTADPGLVGRKYTVVASPAYSDGTARRLPVREVQ